MRNEMNGVLGHDSALYTRPGTTWANEMNFVMNHAPHAESIVGQVNKRCKWNSNIFQPLLIS